MRTAREQQSYTVLSANSPGAVTATGAEPGEVVRAGQTIVQLARQGGLDAVFDVPEQLIRNHPPQDQVDIALTNDPQVKATGRVREIHPGGYRYADISSEGWDHRSAAGDEAGRHCHRTHPADRAARRRGAGEHLAENGGRAAVWVVDAQKHTVSLHNVEVLR